MVRVRFAPSPTGSLHLGSALTAVANRRFADEHGGTLLLRIDDTDPARTVAGAVDEILRDLDWLGVGFDEGPVRQSERAERHREAARSLSGTRADDDGSLRLGRTTLLRSDGTPTYPLATAVDDLDFGITHIIRGSEHREGAALHLRLIEDLGGTPPEVVHLGLLLGPDGKKLSKRHGAASLADLRAEGVPAEAVRAYLEELGLPPHDVHFDPARLRRLSTDAIGALSDEELAARVGVPVQLAPALRGARDLVEARAIGAQIESPQPVAVPADAKVTLERFRELRERANGDLDAERAKGIVRELKAVGGDLRALRVALTGAERGPELWTVVFALPRDEALRRVDAAL
jgi:tRNA synthetases class I (E and Q), catalytic domain